MTLTVIIPTIGRGSLTRALESCAGADEIIVAWDTTASDDPIPASLPFPNVKLIATKGNDCGYTPRNEAIKVATSTHLSFLDDDDIYTPDAIRLFKDAACDVPVVFRVDHYHHGVLWRTPDVLFGNVSTPMFVVPNVPGKLGLWAPHMPGLKEPGGDYTFLAGCVELMGEPVWREEIVAVMRPDRGPTITIVTPWRDHPELAEDYFAAVVRRSVLDELLIVDDGSTMSVREAALRLPPSGFSPACNAGLEAARSEAVLFLNNDIQMVDRAWLETLRAALEPGYLVGAQLHSNAPHASVDGEPMPYLDGWCLAGMRTDLLELDGWDETFQEPSYYGDNDLCLRARASGMGLREARVGLRHKRNATAGDPSLPAVASASLSNRERYLERARDLIGVPA